MKNNILILFFLCISFFTTFAEEYSIQVRDKFQIPIKGASVSFNNEVIISDENGEVLFKSNEKNISLKISKEGFESKDIEIHGSEKNSFNIELKEDKSNRRFIYLAVKYNEYVNSAYFLDELTSTDGLASNVIINFYKDNILVKSIDFNQSTLPILLNYGEYDIRVFDIYSNNILFEKIKVSKDSDDFLILNVKRETFFMSGKVVANNAFLGGVTLSFNDGYGNIFTTITDIDGYFSINLPENYYFIEAEKIGYTIVGQHNIFVNETSGTYNISMKETGSLMSGRIIDQNNNPIQDATVSLRSSLNNIVTVKSNELGVFTAQIPKGMVLVKAEKEGYYISGTLERVENFTSVEGIDIVLEQKIGAIKGYLVNNIKAEKGFTLKLYNSNNEHIGNSKTNSNGFYEFASLPIKDSYYITVEKNNKTYYKSEILKISENEKKDLDILIEIENINVIIELIKNEEVASNVKIIINGEELQSDINGFINKYYSTEEVQVLEINIPEYNISDRINISSETKSPLKLKYNISK